MAVCPNCSKKLEWKQVLKVFFNGNASITCLQCGTKLKQDKKKMKLYYFSIIGMATLLGVGAAITRASWQTALSLLAIWVFIGALFFLKNAKFHEGK